MKGLHTSPNGLWAALSFLSGICAGRAPAFGDFMSDKRSFTLDAMRGIAAFSVVAHHFDTVLPPEQVNNSLLAMPNSYLGVDFFYMLSGFVLVRAYERKLKADLSPLRFMELRFLRLYPMFLLGILLGALNIAGRIAFQTPHALDPAHAVLAFALNALMLPDFLSSGTLYVLNMPAWTLLFEMLINLLFALALFRLRALYLAMFSLACASFYLWGHWRLDEGSIGMTWATALFGFARAGYAFPVGMMMGRAFSTRAAKPSRWSAALLLLLAWIFFLGPPLRFNFAFDVLSLFVALPAIIWTAAHFQPPPLLRRACEAMGDASYPLFVIHFPLLHIAYFVLVRGLHLPAWPTTIAFLPLGFLLALAIFHRVDVPVRRWLSARAKLRPTAMPVTP